MARKRNEKYCIGKTFRIKDYGVDAIGEILPNGKIEVKAKSRFKARNTNVQEDSSDQQYKEEYSKCVDRGVIDEERKRFVKDQVFQNCNIAASVLYDRNIESGDLLWKDIETGMSISEIANSARRQEKRLMLSTMEKPSGVQRNLEENYPELSLLKEQAKANSPADVSSAAFPARNDPLELTLDDSEPLYDIFSDPDLDADDQPAYDEKIAMWPLPPKN